MIVIIIIVIVTIAIDIIGIIVIVIIIIIIIVTFVLFLFRPVLFRLASSEANTTRETSHCDPYSLGEIFLLL